MGFRIKRKAVPPGKPKLKIRKSVAASPVATSKPTEKLETEVIRELIWAAAIRNAHSSDQVKVFERMSDEQYTVYNRRTDQIRMIEMAGLTRCQCRLCDGKCPGTNKSAAGMSVCYDCVFGKHRAEKLQPISTEKKHERESAQRPTDREQKPTVVSRRTRLRIKPKRKLVSKRRR